MTREELTEELEAVVMETATLIKKDRDRLVDALADYVVEELHVELDEEDDETEEE